MNLEIDKKGSVLHITLKRPEVHNALDSELIAGLTKAFEGIKKDFTISSVLLTGAGPSFCAGGDLQWMQKTLKFTKAQNIKDTQKLSNMYEALFQCPVPVLGIVQGNVMGGGIGLTAVCDIVAAESQTRFCLSEVKLGLVPSIISPYLLRKVAETDAKPLMLTAEIFKAPQALEIGLVHFIGGSEECLNYITEKGKLISANGPEATRITKGLIQKIQTSNWQARRKITVKTIADRRVSKEGQEGMNAFLKNVSQTGVEVVDCAS